MLIARYRKYAKLNRISKMKTQEISYLLYIHPIIPSKSYDKLGAKMQSIKRSTKINNKEYRSNKSFKKCKTY